MGCLANLNTWHSSGAALLLHFRNWRSQNTLLAGEHGGFQLSEYSCESEHGAVY